MFRPFLMIAVAAIGNLVAADLTGTWTGTMETNGSQVRIFVTMIQSDDKIAGWLVFGDDTKPVAIENSQIQNENLTFYVHDNVGRQITFRLSVNDTTLEGESTIGDEGSTVSMLKSVYKVGGGVSAPVVIKYVSPEYSKEGRAARIQGRVVLNVEVDPSGKATNIRVTRTLGVGLDEKAIECVKKWKFKPGYKNGLPVTVAVTIEITFQL